MLSQIEEMALYHRACENLPDGYFRDFMLQNRDNFRRCMQSDYIAQDQFSAILAGMNESIRELKKEKDALGREVDSLVKDRNAVKRKLAENLEMLRQISDSTARLIRENSRNIE